MKLKQRPEDFQVEELTDVQPVDTGPFALYRLEKRGWTTLDALTALRRRWKIDHRRVSYGGLKDRHAHTIQYVTVFRGPRRRLTHQGVSVEYLGQVREPFTSRDIRGNRFRLVLREIGEHEREKKNLTQALEEIRRDGIANYFDDQRFGSVGDGKHFVAREMVLERYEDALRLALTGPYDYDRAPQKKEKKILREHWGDWKTCRDLLPAYPELSLLDHLVFHPEDFRGALARLRPDLRTLYLSAYQSHLWNRMLARWLREHLRPEQLKLIPLCLGNVPMHHGLDEDQRRALADLFLPLPTARLHLEPTDSRLALIGAVLKEEGLELSQLKLKGFRTMFFSKGDRAALCLPEGLRYSFSADEIHPGKEKLELAFDLPRGSYATLVAKRVTG